MPQQPDIFTKSAQQVLEIAQGIAFRQRHAHLTTDHVLLAMTRAQDTNAFHALREVDIIESKLTRFLRTLHPPSDAHPLRYTGLEVSPTVQEVIQLSYVHATLRGDDYIGSGHLLVGMMRVKSKTVDAVLDHFSLKTKQVIKAAEYYLQHSVEVTKHRIPIEIAPEQAGCIGQLRALLTDALSRPQNRKQKNDE